MPLLAAHRPQGGPAVLNDKALAASPGKRSPSPPTRRTPRLCVSPLRRRCRSLPPSNNRQPLLEFNHDDTTNTTQFKESSHFCILHFRRVRRAAVVNKTAARTGNLAASGKRT